MMTDLVRSGRTAASLLLMAVLFAACRGDSTGPGARGEVAVVLNSVENSLTVVSVEGGGEPRTIGLGGANATPTTLAVRGNLAAVPLGLYPFVAVVDLSAGAVLRTVALSEGSGATGVAFLNDSIAVVANPELNTVTPVNVLRGTTGAQIAVGTYPQRVVASGGRVYVVNANLEMFSPAGPGSVTVVDENLAVAGTIALSGFNPGAAVFVGGRLYVVHSGNWGVEDGSLSAVDVSAATEIDHHTGFGDGPVDASASPVGRLYVAAWGEGIFVWDPLTKLFTRDPADPLRPDGAQSVSATGFDDAGRLYAIDPGNCTAPGRLLRLGDGGTVTRTVQVGVCPVAVIFAEVPR
jgi:hypothetical protein